VASLTQTKRIKHFVSRIKLFFKGKNYIFFLVYSIKKMGGGLMQLVAYGAQDIYLTGNPQITFFKVVYRRHTNFAMEAIEQTINGTPTSGGTSTVTISRNGDLVHKVFVTSTDVTIAKDGSSLVNEVELEIGGQKIDKHYEEWNQIWNELSTPDSKAIGLKAMIGDTGTVGTEVGMCQIPLNFWFCRNPGLALPLIALQYHEVKLKFKWSSTAGVVSTAPKVVCDYIYLDTDERRRFAQVSHEYLIEQLQKQSLSASTSNKLNFNHPVKELIWTSAATNAYLTARLKLNGHDRFSNQEEEYFQLRQPYDHHTAIPAQNLPTGAYAAARAGTTAYTEMLAPILIVPPVSEATSLDVGASKKISVSTADGTECGATDTATSTVYAFFGVDLVTPFVANSVYLFNTSYNTGADVVRQQSLVTCTSTAGLANALAADGAAAATLTLVTTGGVQAGTYTPAAATIGATFDSIIYNNSTSAIVDENAATALTINSIILVADAGCRTSAMTKKINVYSFGLKPEEHQPSGTCNFSRIDNAQLVTGANLAAADNIYAVNYNVLRIMSGMGGLAYSN
jgi:hypothetical protein